MTRAQLRLELLRMIYHGGKEPRHILEIAAQFEPYFDGLLSDGLGADELPTPAKSSEPAKKTTTTRK